jgi:hypothetical protein
MNNEHYRKQLDLLVGLAEKSADRQLSFFQHILLVSSSTFGILISLHSNSSSCLYIRMVFSLATVLLSLGCLSSALAVFDHSFLVERARQAFRSEVQNAIREDREVTFVVVEKKKRTVFCEKACYILLCMSMLLLSFYSVIA